MGYCTVADIRVRYDDRELARLTDDTNTSVKTVDENVISGFITDSSSEIDGYLQNRYTVPVTVANELLKTWCIDLTIFRIVERRAGLRGDVPESIVKKRERVISQLQRVNEGKMSLAITRITDLPGSAPNTPIVVRTRSEKVFTPEWLDRFRDS